MATYNRAHLLTRAVRSVLGQTYQNFELIIVDDGSTDGTTEVCQAFKDKRILCHRQTRNLGVQAARNKGFDLAKGDYIALLDDDDELLPEALETARDKFGELSSKGVKIIWFEGLDLERKQSSGSTVLAEGYIHYQDILCERVRGDFWQVLQRGILTPDDRFDERLLYGEILLWLRLHRNNDAYYVPKVLRINHREHGTERLTDLSNMLRHAPMLAAINKALLEGYGEEQKRLCPRVYGHRLGTLGVFDILSDKKTEGRRACRESLRYAKSPTRCIVLLLSFILSGALLMSAALTCAKMLGGVQHLRIRAKSILRADYRTPSGRP